jgi:phosphomannomutase
MDLFPVGWDKRFSLQFIQNHLYDEIHFFGDQTQKGGNDHELYHDPRVVGHSVTSPEDTLKQLQDLFPINDE